MSLKEGIKETIFTRLLARVKEFLSLACVFILFKLQENIVAVSCLCKMDNTNKVFYITTPFHYDINTQTCAFAQSMKLCIYTMYVNVLCCASN